ELFQKHYDALEEHHINAGHCPHDDAPAEVDALLRNWVINTVQDGTKVSDLPPSMTSQWVPLG
ncbi:MAG: alpha/beta hydrolase, partial [Cyanobacteria bacterium J06635_11]